MKEYTRDNALEVVEAGYDQIGDRYTEERLKGLRWDEVDEFFALLPGSARVLDAGCGTGIPNARRMVEMGYEVIGIDISKQMVETARKNVPGATFHRMNMSSIELQSDSFDGVISTYAIIHNPRETHSDIFKSFHRILKPDGVMLASVASWAWEEFADYMGVDMYWSHFDPDKSQSLITEAGFDIIFARDVEAGGEKHHWVLARKPANE